jgi:hypothetical protein
MLADFSYNLIRCYNIEFSHAVSAYQTYGVIPSSRSVRSSRLAV